VVVNDRGQVKAYWVTPRSGAVAKAAEPAPSAAAPAQSK